MQLTRSSTRMAVQHKSFTPEPNSGPLSPLNIGSRRSSTTPANAPPTTVDIDEELNVKFLGSFALLGAVAVETPPLRYDFHSGAASPVLRPRINGPGPATNSPIPTTDDVYKYLNIQPNQLRLLLLSRGQPGDVLNCSLKTVESRELGQSTLIYQALSYAWGPEDDSDHSILLRDMDIPMSEDGSGRNPGQVFSLIARQVTPRRFRVRSILYRALKELRSTTEDLWFWIDAVCINQTNDGEKTHQLSKMLSIYSSAQNVCIWICEDEASRGDSDMPINTAMEFVPSIINLTVLERIISGDKVDEQIARSCRAFARLLKSPWFGRRWVIQEVSGARRASIQCGNDRMNWIDFADAVELFTAYIEAIRSMYNKSDTCKDDPDALGHVESAGAKAIVSSCNNVLRKARNGTIIDRPLDIESLAMTFIHFDASDPRDTIYALLALASDGQFSSSPHKAPSLHPNYTKTSMQVYMEFVRHCVVARGSLDIICRNWALPVKGLPF